MLACGNFSCFYYGLIKEAGYLDGALLVVGEITAQNKAIVGRIERICGIRLELAQVDKVGFMKAARHLRAGGVLATMMDTYAASSGVCVATMFGKEVFYDRAFFDLAVRYKARVIPACVISKSWRFEQIVGPVSDAADLEVDALVGRVLGFFEETALRYPGQWMAWSNLFGRLRRSEERYDRSHNHRPALM